VIIWTGPTGMAFDNFYADVSGVGTRVLCAGQAPRAVVRNVPAFAERRVRH
jgi:hypothetical protein